MSSQRSLLTSSASIDFAYNPTNDATINQPSMHVRSYPMMLELIRESLFHPDDSIQENNTNNIDNTQQSIHSRPISIPTLDSILLQANKETDTELDEKQTLAYHSICATFMLGLIQDGKDDNTLLGQYFTGLTGHSASSTSAPSTTEKLITTKLKSMGGREQLIMFLTGPAGAGKTTAIKIAEKFCFQLCKAISMIWKDNTFLFTAYTGSAASAFGGVTTCSAAFLNKDKELSDDDKTSWDGVRIVIIDEVSFLKLSEIHKLNKNLQAIGDSTKVFGGFSIIFCGDFRQLEPPSSSPDQLLFNSHCGGWENKLNAIIFLENKHRFKEDPRYGDLLKRMWEGNLTKEDREWLNERYVGHNGKGLRLPKSHEFEDADVVYAAPTNRERNAITAGNFRHHILQNCPAINTNELPPQHTIIIEAEILSSAPSSSTQFNKRITGSMRHRIHTTCGDSICMSGTKHIDPALCLYTGAHLICTIGNESLREKVPRGNGTLCRLLGIKLKNGVNLTRWKNYYDRKVWTVSASDVEWIECEHYPKSPQITELEHSIQNKREEIKRTTNRQTKSQLRNEIRQLSTKLTQQNQAHTFRLKTKTSTTKIDMKSHSLATATTDFKCKLIQFPVNCNDATTGHKLQGMTKDVVIITSWPSGGLFKNWEYVVLSRVKTHKGLYLFQKIPMDKDFSPSKELCQFFNRARKKEQIYIKENRKFKKQLKELIETNDRR